MKYTNLHSEFERPTYKAHRPKSEWETFGQAVKEFSIAIVVVGLLLIIGNIILGLN